ncbi:MAG: serine/threonine-protein kinase [Planctomycetaceae bacterium]
MTDTSKQQHVGHDSACPNRAELVTLLEGNLPTDVVAELAGHVEACMDCQKMLESIEDPSDSLLAELRGATPADIAVAQQELSLQHSMSDTRILELLGLESEIQQRLTLPCDLGQYRLERHAGRGGMGDVYLGLQKTLNRPTAIKLLRPNRSASMSAAARFKQEMQIIAMLDHPNLVKAYDGGEFEGRLYLAMELLDGETLADYVKQRGPVAPRRACQICIRAARGLHHAHTANSFHRDVKPGNIMLTRDGKVKVLDLGLALVSQPEGNDKDSISFAGTPEFMAPEQARNASTADARSDIYSLGCTLFFLLTGQSVFPRPKYLTVADCIRAHQHEPIPDVRTLNPAVPEELARILQRMLSKDPDSRPQTAADVCKLLEPFSQGDVSDATESPGSNDRSPSNLLSTLKGQRKIVLWVGGLLLSGSLIFVAANVMKDTDDKSSLAVSDSKQTGTYRPLEPGDPDTSEQNAEAPGAIDRTEGGFPVLSGFWQEGDRRIVVQQQDDQLIAHCRYTDPELGDVRWTMAGSVDRAGVISADLWHVDRPNTPGVVQKRKGALQNDGTIYMHAYTQEGSSTKNEDVFWKPTAKVPSNPTETEAIPVVMGKWRFENHVVSIVQAGTEFVAQCSFRHQNGNASQWIQEGTILADGTFQATLYPILSPPNEIAVGTWIGRLETDGAIRGQALWKAGPKWKAGGHPFTFTRIR